jgi:hypothetical protein
MIKGKIFNNINVDEDLKNMSVLHPLWSYKMNLRISTSINFKGGESEKDHLWNTRRVFAERPIMERSEIHLLPRAFLHMVHNCFVTEDSVSQLLRPGMLWHPLQTEPNMKG